MKEFEVTAELTSAWEVWTIQVPDDAEPTAEWLKENPGDWELVSLDDSGNDNEIIVEVTEVTPK